MSFKWLGQKAAGDESGGTESVAQKSRGRIDTNPFSHLGSNISPTEILQRCFISLRQPITPVALNFQYWSLGILNSPVMKWQTGFPKPEQHSAPLKYPFF